MNEISRGGCYIEAMSPLRTGTPIRLELSIGGRTLRMGAIVRTSQPTCGMGVEFTRMAPAEAEKLCRVVAALGGEAHPSAPAGDAPQAPPEVSTPATEIGEAVLRWFGSHEVLSRQELLKLLEQSERAQKELAPL